MTFLKLLTAAGACVTTALLVKHRQKLLDLLKPYNRYEKRILERMVTPENLRVTWSNVAGEVELEAMLRQKVLNPLRLAQFTPHLPPTPIRAVLLHGPAGCGKSLIAEAMANELQANFMRLDLPIMSSLTSKKFVSAVVSIAKEQRCVVFIDQVDELCPLGIEGLKILLEWLDNAVPQAVVVATARRKLTNPLLAFFPMQVAVPLPDRKKRLEILKLVFCYSDLCEDVDLQELARKTKGMSCRDLFEVYRWATWCALGESLPSRPIEDYDAVIILAGGGVQCPLAWRHFEEAIEQVQIRRDRNREDTPLNLYM